MGVDWLAVSRAASGHADPSALDPESRVEFENIITSTEESLPPTELDLEQKKFWRDMNELEVAIASKQDELGEGTPEMDAWQAELVSMSAPGQPKKSRKRK